MCTPQSGAPQPACALTLPTPTLALQVGTHTQLMRRGGIYAALVRRQAGAVLDQERDLAPHELQVSSSSSSSGSGGGGGSDSHQQAGEGEGGAEGSGAGGGAGDSQGEQQLPDSLPQWRAQQRLRTEHDPA